MLAPRLARYGVNLAYEDLSASVVHEVKRRLLDSVGCAMGAWNADPCRIARRMVEAVKVPDGATVWGTRHRTLPDLAAFANGTLVRYLDFNDTYLSKEPAHPSDNMAAVLAAGESARSSGRLVVLALALAYEIQCRFCDAAALRPRGWDHVTYGAFSTALGVAKVLDLSEAETLQALNLSGVANISLRQTRVGYMSMWKACAFANASRNAVFATLLAKQGMTGPSPIFEGEKGFVKLVSGPLDLPLLAGEQRDSGPSFKIMDTYIKHYPVEYHAQTAVEAALALRDEMVRTEGPGVLAEISRIVVDSYDVAIEIIGRDPEKWLPRTRETADHSFPYCVAVALLDGDVTVASFDEKRLEDPLVQACMRKVHVRHEPQFETSYPDTMPTRITIETTGERMYSRQVDVPLGHPKHQMSDAQLEEKFIRLAAGALDRDQMEKVIELVWQLDNLEDVGAFISLLQVAG